MPDNQILHALCGFHALLHHIEPIRPPGIQPHDTASPTPANHPARHIGCNVTRPSSCRISALDSLSDGLLAILGDLGNHLTRCGCQIRLSARVGHVKPDASRCGDAADAKRCHRLRCPRDVSRICRLPQRQERALINPDSRYGRVDIARRNRLVKPLPVKIAMHIRNCGKKRPLKRRLQTGDKLAKAAGLCAGGAAH